VDDNVELTLTINKPLKDLNELVLTKDGVKVMPKDEFEIKFENIDRQNEQVCKISVLGRKLKPYQKGQYKLVLKKQNSNETDELGKTNLTVDYPIIEVLEPLKADKEKYLVGDKVKLTIKLSKPLEDDVKCANWSLNGKLIDTKSKDLEVGSEKNPDGTVVYFLIVKKSKIDQDSGEYRLRLKSKPDDEKSEFYNSSITVKIDEKPLEILESNWKQEISLPEDENLELFLIINKQIKDINDIVLTKEGKKGLFL
jgi:hypothetical protein